jgi:hypothetical protein
MGLLQRLLGGTADNVTFCDGCTSACDDRCRSDALLEQARSRALSVRAGSW